MNPVLALSINAYKITIKIPITHHGSLRRSGFSPPSGPDAVRKVLLLCRSVDVRLRRAARVGTSAGTFCNGGGPPSSSMGRMTYMTWKITFIFETTKPVREMSASENVDSLIIQFISLVFINTSKL